MLEDELRRKLVAGGLGRVADALVALAQPAIKIHLEPADEARTPVGASKVGGLPDLPAGAEWPRWHEPMAFLAQFNLAEVAPFDVEGVLPDRGLLSFFFETDGEPLYSAGWGLPEGAPPRDLSAAESMWGWRVLYHDADPTTYVRQVAPDETGASYSPCAVTMSSCLTLPSTTGEDVSRLSLTGGERAALIDLEAVVNRADLYARGDEGHRLLGYPHEFAGPTLVLADAAMRAAPSDEWGRTDRARQRELEAAASARWRLLLQLDSSEAAGMDWGGGGLLFFTVEREALRRRDFSRVWLDMQFL